MLLVKKKSLVFIITVIVALSIACGVFFLLKKDKVDKTYTTYSVCRRNNKLSGLGGSETIFIAGGKTYTSVEKKIKAFVLNDELGLGKSNKQLLCNNEEIEANKNIYPTFNCDDENIYSNYYIKKDIEKVLEEYLRNDYQCITYEDKNNKVDNYKIVGTWCLQFTNGEYTNTYKYTFDENGRYSGMETYGKNNIIEELGYYSFDNKIIKRITTSKDNNFYGSSYDEFLSYNSDDDTIINSNIREEFPNIMTKCN